MWLSGGRAAWWQILLTALPATAAIAFLSWHLVERPMLRLKPDGPRPAPAYAPAAQRA
jgi:peptidoglycan/LPS O-acetylase OafA/YrhL